MRARGQVLIRGISAGLLFLWIASATLPGDEPGTKFLNELRAKGYFDVALQYLDAMQASPMAGDDFRRRIVLEKVETLVQYATVLRDPREHEARLDEAQRLLDQFLAGNPLAELRSEAERTRAGLLLGRAKSLMMQAANDRLTSGVRDDLRAKARALLTTADESFRAHRVRLRGDLESFKIDPADPQSAARLEALRDEYQRTRFMEPSLAERIADTFGQAVPQRNELLERAAAGFVDLYDDYRTRPGALDACLSAARCYQKLGRYSDAKTYWLEILSQDNHPAFYQIKARAALLALDGWEAAETFPFYEAVEYLTPVIESMKTHDAREPDWLRLQLGFARACWLKAQALDERGPSDAEGRRQINELERVAEKVAKDVARIPSPYRTPAQELLAQMNVAVRFSPDGDAPAAPTTLEEARTRGRELLAQCEDLQIEIQRLTADAAGEGSAAEQAAQSLHETRAAYLATSREALALLRRALELAAPETPRDDYTYTQYLQSVCYFQMERFPEAIVIGRFLADRYPTNAGARDAAGVVAKAQWQLYQNADDDAKAFYRDQLAVTCQLIFDRWPNSVEAETAGRLLTVLAIKENRFDDALQSLERVPRGAPGRQLLVLSLGQMLWADYQTRRRAAAGGAADPPASQRDQARALLEQGLVEADLQHVTALDARAALSLAELLLDQGDTAGAVHRLEQADIAPLDLIKQKHAAAADVAFRTDTYRTCVRAYLLGMQSEPEAQPWVQKANGVIAALELELKQQPDGQRQIVGIYFALARQLKDQFDRQSDPTRRAAFARDLSNFLESIVAGADEPQLRYWCAAMFGQIALSLDETGGREDALRAFTQSEKLLRQLATELKNNPSVDPVFRMQVRRELALTLRGRHDFEKSIAQFADILSDPQFQNMADLQFEAAETYMVWGRTQRITEPLVRAIMGGSQREITGTKRNQNVIWGWTRLAKSAQTNKQDELFLRALYHLVLTKTEYGRLKESRDVLEAALREITNFVRSKPEAGGAEWKPKFEQLAKDLQAELGLPKVGLATK